MTARHAPFVRSGSGTAVIFFHGILGTPRHFDELVQRVPDGWGVYVPLLSGHGGTADDFSSATMAQWKAQTHALVQKVQQHYSTVLLAGHSMGTLFAIDEARQSPSVRGLFLLAAPLRVGLRPKAVSDAWKVALDHMPPGDAAALAAKRAYSIAPERNVWTYLRWVPNYLALFSEIRRARQNVRSLSVPCMVFQSEKDEMVARSAAKVLQKNPHICCTVLPESTHSAYSSADRAQILWEFERFCRMFQTKNERQSTQKNE